MKKIITILLTFLASSCSSYFTARPPVIEDKVGLSGREIVGTLSTAPDYRVVYVKLDDKAKLCAEASPDAGAQFASTFASALTAQVSGTTTPLSAEATANLTVAMKQLFRRTQGVQLYRDGAFALCNLYLNGGIEKPEYYMELQALRMSAAELIKQEIPYIEKLGVDPIQAPNISTVPADGHGK